MFKTLFNTSKAKITLLLLFLLFASYILTLVYDFFRILLVAVLFCALLIIYKKSNLTSSDIGLSKAKIMSGIKWGIIAMTMIGIGIFLAAIVQPSAFKDARYHQTLPDAIKKSIIFIPFATVLFEEFIFRGLILALFGRKFTNNTAVILSSICFGLWHIFSSLGVNILTLNNGLLASFLTIILVVIATSAAGIVLCVLRLKSDSLIAPIIAHWSINSFALFASAIVWRM